jgi:malonyl-CoA/methylmalonyl-CoA synthetase
MAVPTIYSKLIHAFDSMSIEKQREAKLACSKFRLMISGSSSLPKRIFDRWEEISGHRLLERYGMTEIGMALGNPLEGPRIPSFVGFPFPGVQVKINSEKDFAPGFASAGELFVKSKQIFKEYWKRPIETLESFDEHGW